MSNAVSSDAATATTLASTIQTKYEKQLLAKAAGRLVWDKFATTKVVGRGEGGTLKINKLTRVAKKTTADTAGTIYDYSDAKELSSQYIDVSPSFWGDSFGITDEASIQSFLKDEDNQAEIASHMARSLDYQVSKEVSTHCLRHRIDKADTTHQVSGTADSGSTTTMVDDARTESDDAWNGGYLTYTSPEGPNYDQTAKVSDFVASTDTTTTAAMTGTPTTSSTYRLTVGTDLAATDVMSTSGLIDVSGMHRKLETEKFDNGLYRCFLDAAQESDLWADSTFLNSAIYDNSGRFKNYRLGRWFDIEFMISSELYREDVDGTENQSTGISYVAPIFGAKAYSVVRWGQGQGDFNVKFHYVDTPDSMNLRMGRKWISWKAYFAAKVLRSTSVIGLMTGATDQNLVI